MVTRPRRRSRLALSIALALAALFAVLGAITASGCNLVLGLSDYRDCCKPIGIGDPPDCVYCDAGVGTAGGGGMNASTSSTGGSGGCDPKSTKSCWDGPKLAEKVGICKDGKQTCQGDRTWGKCEEELLPKAETCASTDDEDCNGLDCVEWAEAFVDKNGKPAIASADGVAVDAKDRTLVFGSLKQGTVKLGETTVKNESTFTPPVPAAYVAVLDSTGKLIWGNGIGTGAFTAAIADTEDHFYLAGVTAGPVQFGTTSIPVGQFLLQLDAKDGTVNWIRPFGDTSTSTATGPRSLVACSTGQIAIAGAYSSAVNFGGVSHDLVNGAPSNYVSILASADGSEKTTYTFEATAIDDRYFGPFIGSNAACDTLSIFFNFENVVHLFGHQATSHGGIDIGIATAPLNRNIQGYPSAVGDAADQVLLYGSVGPDGTALLGGTFHGSMSFDGTTTVSSTSSTPDPLNGDGFIYASNRLTLSFQTQGLVTSASVSPDGNLAFVGSFSGSLSLGNQVLDGSHGTPLLLAKVDPVGSVLWARAFQHGTDGDLLVRSASYSDSSESVVGGSGAFPLNVGSGPLNTVTQPQIGFAARFAP